MVPRRRHDAELQPHGRLSAQDRVTVDWPDEAARIHADDTRATRRLLQKSADALAKVPAAWAAQRLGEPGSVASRRFTSSAASSSSISILGRQV
jgi:hypothetical protein